jgi:hypothetical protein
MSEIHIPCQQKAIADQSSAREVLQYLVLLQENPSLGSQVPNESEKAAATLLGASIINRESHALFNCATHIALGTCSIYQLLSFPNGDFQIQPRVSGSFLAGYYHTKE